MKKGRVRKYHPYRAVFVAPTMHVAMKCILSLSTNLFVSLRFVFRQRMIETLHHSRSDTVCVSCGISRKSGGLIFGLQKCILSLEYQHVLRGSRLLFCLFLASSNVVETLAHMLG